jgi:heme exporter protein CcmD
VTHLSYIVPAYALTVGGLMTLLAVSWWQMRVAEAAAEKLRDRGR